MDRTLSQRDILRISRILADDNEAICKRFEIHDGLGLSSDDELEDLKRKMVWETSLGVHFAYAYFRDVLTRYKSMNGLETTVQSLNAVFAQLQLIKVTEILEREYGLDSQQIEKTRESSESDRVEKISKIKEQRNPRKHLKGGDLAIRIEQVSAFFQPTSYIPVNIFKRLKPVPFPSQDELDAAMSILKDYYNMIRRTGRVVEANMSDSDLQLALEQGLDLLINYMSEDGNSEMIKSLIPHALSVWKNTLKYDDDLVRKYATFPSHVCIKLNAFQRYEEMLELAHDSVKNLTRVLGPKHVDTIRMVFTEGIALSQLGKYSESTKVLTANHSFGKSGFGADENLTIEISILQALNLDEEGNRWKQLRILESVENMTIAKFGPEHYIVSMTRYLKACVLKKLGQLDAALDICRSSSIDIAQIRSRVSMIELQDTWNLKTMGLICRILNKKGQLKEALMLSEEIDELLRQVLGEDHACTLKNIQIIRICKANCEMEIAKVSAKGNSALSNS